jgi:ubiquinone/menaquinone biosynthesis C-methylase UbiE
MRDNMPQVARYWNSVAHDFDAIYTGEKSPVGRVLDRVFRKDIYERFDWVMETAGDVRGKTVCDIGCGSGRFVSALARRGAAHVTGVDVAPEMLKLASELVRTEGVSDVCSFVNADVLDWKTDQQFDFTIAIGFWDYIADPLPRLRVIRRMTRGAFLSAWPRFWTWRMPVRKVRLTALGCPVYFFRREQVTQLLEEAGFRPGPLRVVGKLYCVEAHPA